MLDGLRLYYRDGVVKVHEHTDSREVQVAQQQQQQQQRLQPLKAQERSMLITNLLNNCDKNASART